jgi:Ca2+-binding EF-hand superfamily protein
LAVFASEAFAQDRVSVYDADRNGRVEYTELSAQCHVSRKLFDRADRDGDGVLSNAELQRARRYLLTDCKSVHG